MAPRRITVPTSLYDLDGRCSSEALRGYSLNAKNIWTALRDRGGFFNNAPAAAYLELAGACTGALREALIEVATGTVTGKAAAARVLAAVGEIEGYSPITLANIVWASDGTLDRKTALRGMSELRLSGQLHADRAYGDGTDIDEVVWTAA